MKILITGADGFVGAPLTRALLAQGMDVGAVVLPGEPLRRLTEAETRRLHLLHGSLTEMDGLRPALAAFRPDACLHLAWYAEPGKYLHSPNNLPMLQGSLALMHTLLDAGCKQMIGAGTCAEYDTEQGWLKEDGRTNPETLYAAAKLSLCLCGEQLARAGDMAFAWGRIFYPYGPQEDPRRMVPALIRALLANQPFPASGGEQIRDYLHVEDIAQAFVTLLTEKATGIYNIGSGDPVPVRRVMETIEDVVGKHGLIQYGGLPSRNWEPRFICADMGKLRGLGWKPAYTLRQGLEATVQWWREQSLTDALG